MRHALNALLGKQELFFVPYSNHHMGRHSYKKADGLCLFPCKSKDDAIAIVGDLLDNGLLEHQTAGILIIGGSKVIEKVTLDCIKKALRRRK